MRGFLGSPVPRPLAVTLIGGVLWALSAGLLILGIIAIVSFCASHGLQMTSIFVALIGVGAPGLIALGVATAFMELRAWGRIGVEALLWLLAARVTVSIYRTANLSIHPSATSWVVHASVLMLTIFAILALHRPAVREAFAAAEAARKAANPAAPVEP